MTETKKQKPAKLWIYRVSSIITALLIWVMVTVTQNPLDETIFMISLEHRAAPESLILDKTVNQVQVRVQATAAVIKELTAADLAVYVDLGGLKAGKHVLEVMAEHPNNVQVLSLRPLSVEVELKETLTDIFPLEAEVLGEPAAGYKRLEALLSPAEVKLTGTREQLRRVGRVYVSAFLQDAEESFDKGLSVMVDDWAGNDISSLFTIEPRVARLVAPVLDEQPERLVAVRALVSGQAEPGYQLSLLSATPQMVRLFGDLARLQSLNYVDTEPVDISGLTADTSLTVRLRPPNGFTAYPSEVTVAIQIEPVESVSVTKSLILCQNVNEGCAAEVEQLRLTVTVYGPESFMAALDEDAIVPYVDCGGLWGGDYELPILVSLPANITQMNISRETAKVSIIGPEEEPPDEAEAAGGLREATLE